jgi:hypothetical protein
MSDFSRSINYEDRRLRDDIGRSPRRSRRARRACPRA